MTREELHALVWSKPMRLAAKEHGISDVGLAKQCRKASVPLPPRGYWNKVHAGKKVTPQALPPLSMAPAARLLTGLFPAYAKDFDLGTAEIPRRPEFDDINEVTRRIMLAVGEVRISSRIGNPHPIVARLLRQDEERRAKASPNSSMYDYYGPKFDKPIQQRRLRILLTLIATFEKLGLKPHGSTHAGERFSVEFSRGPWVYILLAVENGPHGDPFYRDRGRARLTSREGLRFDITSHSVEHESPSNTWRDSDVAPLESQVGEIVCGVLLKGELDARRWVTTSYEWTVEERARKAEEARMAVERAKAEHVARLKAAAEARLSALLTGADALESAERIRRYVAAVRQRANAADPALLEQWSTWALAEADTLDPVLSGRVTADLQAHVREADFDLDDPVSEKTPLFGHNK